MKIVGLVLVVVVFWLAAFGLIYNFLPSWELRGQFGDLFGSVNALFSGFAFAGLLYTIHLQRRELSLQREELRLQREEMTASRGELIKQVETQKKQYYASIAALKVQAASMEVEALKMEAERVTPGFREQFWGRIREQSKQIQIMVNDLEND